MSWVSYTPRHIIVVLYNTYNLVKNGSKHMFNIYIQYIYMGIYVLDNVFIYLGHISWTEFICIGVFLQYMYWIYVLECIYMYWITMSRIVVR